MDSKPENPVGQPYDFEFVTFLRHILSLDQEATQSSFTWHKTVTCAQWIDQDQGVFRVNNKQEFATGWYTFKVTFIFLPPRH